MRELFLNIWRLVWRLKSILLTIALLLSLGLNLILFVGGSLFSAVNSGFEALSGIQTIASRNKAEIASLSEDVIIERKAKREVKGQLAETSAELVAERNAKRALRSQVSDQAAELASFRVSNRQLKSQVRDIGLGIVPFKGKKVALSAAIDETADMVNRRAVKTAKREVASMPAEAIPYLGTAMIVGVTALELYDLCATLKDMSALKRAFNPDFGQSDEELEVCAMKVPPKAEIIEAVKASPEKAWAAATAATPSWSELKQVEFPDVSWAEMWSTTTSGASDIWDNTAEGANDIGAKVKKWWSVE
ncbi:hypothetical protein [Nereida ignava]|uniref:hypothetical protein n=1 Tax=Nereida ignava TaxID=282199 RepID=UPI0023B63552